jgi:integration host factor subunit alpha
MNKPEIAERLAKQTGLSVHRAMKVLNSLFSTRKGRGLILSELEAGREFRVAGFGTFSVRKRKARPGRNPKTGEKIKIPARKYIVFHPGAGTRTRITQ